MPSLRPNLNNTRATISYNRFPLSSVQFSKSFFPFFSKLWSSLNKNIKYNTDFLKFKENLSFLYKPTKNRHFNYGTKILNSHRFVTGLSENKICPKCTENKTENIDHFVMSCPAYSLPRALLIHKVTLLISNFSSFAKKQQLYILLNGGWIQTTIFMTVEMYPLCLQCKIIFYQQNASRNNHNHPSFIPHSHNSSYTTHIQTRSCVITSILTLAPPCSAPFYSGKLPSILFLSFIFCYLTKQWFIVFSHSDII